MPTSDAELVRQALAGSQAAYRTLVARYAFAAVNVAARLVHDRAVADGHPGPAAEDPASSPEDELERRDLATALQDALSRLRSEYREVIVLRYQQGLTVDEIARALQLPEGTVKTFLHRARKELAVMLSAAGWKP